MLEEWAPVSPSGKLDAVEWKVPLTEIDGPRVEIDKRELSVVSRVDAGAARAAGPQDAPLAQPAPPTTPISGPAPAGPPRVSLIAGTVKGEPKPVAVVEPPLPDDPGVDADEQPEGRRSNAL